MRNLWISYKNKIGIDAQVFELHLMELKHNSSDIEGIAIIGLIVP